MTLICNLQCVYSGLRHSCSFWLARKTFSHSPGFSHHIQPFYAEVRSTEPYEKWENKRYRQMVPARLWKTVTKFKPHMAEKGKPYFLILQLWFWHCTLQFPDIPALPDPTLLEFQNSLSVSRSYSLWIMCFQRQEYHVILNPKVHPIDSFPEVSSRDNIAQSFLTKVSNAQRK